ncbi:MAG: hypothetical protein MJ239_07380 [Bacilli bacterium]|nr:hypothetical protein [Bacilli bacterium]
MKKITKKASICLSSMIAICALGSCGNGGNEWKYTKETMSEFVDLKGSILNRQETDYNDYYIDTNFEYFKDAITASDLKVFNYTKINEEIASGKTDDYLSYDLITKYQASVKEVKKVNDGQDIKITFSGNDDDIYGVLVWGTGSTLNTPIISLAGESSNAHEANTVQTEFEEKYINSEEPSWDKAKIALNLLGNICSMLLGYKDGSASAIGGGVFGLINLLGDTFIGESGPTLIDVINKLNEISKKIDAISEKITMNHNQLLEELVRTQAQIDQVLLNGYETNITSFNTDFIMPINDFKRNLTDFVSQRLKEFVKENQTIDLYYSKDSSNQWEHHSVSDSTEGLTQFRINLDDFKYSKAFLSDHGNVVCHGFVDEFKKDIDSAVGKATSKPEGMTDRIFGDHILEQVFESIIRDRFYNDHAGSLEVKNKAINFIYRISGKDSKSIVEAYVERIKYMFNFAVEGKDMYRSLLSNLLLQLDINATLGSAACRYAEIDQKDLGEAYLEARKVIVDTYKNLSKLNDNYCYQTKNSVDGHFYKVRDFAGFTSTGNHPDFKHYIELRKTVYYPKDEKTMFEAEERLEDHNFINSADNIRMSTRWKLMLENGLSDKKSFVEYLTAAGAIDVQGLNGFKNLVKTGYISKDDKMRIFAGGLSSRKLEDSDRDLKLTCIEKGGPDGSNYFEVDKQYNYKGVHSGDCWSGMIYEGTFLDGTTGTIDNNYKKVCAYARYDEEHWYWRNYEHWILIDNPAGNFFFAMDYVSSK